MLKVYSKNTLKEMINKAVLTTTAATLMCSAPLANASAYASQVPTPQDKPNILFIITEDTGATYGCYVDLNARTPNLDAFAAESVMYTNMYTTMGVCSPSRCSFITGMYQQSIGGQHMRTASPAAGINYRTVPPPEVKTLPELLRADGYFAFLSGKTDFQITDANAGSPFTCWDRTGASRPDYWKIVDNDQPFFGWITMNDTHEAYLFPNANPPAQYRFLDSEDVVLPPYYPDTPVVRSNVAKHYNNLYYSDALFGQILDGLEADGLADSTIVIVTSDHGPLPRQKREIYDAGVHVPLIIRYPEKYRPENITPGTVDDRLVSSVDIAPSILALVGADVPDYMQGQVAFGANTDNPREYVYFARDRVDDTYDRQRGVRDNRYKYMYNFYPGTATGVHIAYRDTLPMMQEMWDYLEKGLLNDVQKIWFEGRPVEQLYDTWNDPHEINNVADDPEYADVLERMRGAYNDWMAVTPDLSEMLETEMIELFWPGGVQPSTAIPKFNLSFANGKAQVTLEGVTEGSSMGYQIVGVDSSTTWRLYTGSFEVPLETQIRAKAVRYGYSESGVVTFSPIDFAYDLTSPVSKIVAGYAANIPADITFAGEAVPFDLGLYNPDSVLIDTIKVSANGRYTFRITKSDTTAVGSYIIKEVGTASGFSIDCVAQPEDLWAPVITCDDKSVTITFASDVTFNEAKKGVKIGEVTIANNKVSVSGQVVTITDVTAAMGQSIVISGVKYADLFPSYSFTFTLAP